MITRFNYGYSLRDAWHGIQQITAPDEPTAEPLTGLFPGAALHLVSSARMGISYALQSFDLKPGARVGVQPYTCSSVLSAIVTAGCRPLFIDINDQLTLDTADLQRKVSAIDALIVTHTFGIPANVQLIRQLAGHLPIIEDCAHAFPGQRDGDLLGSFFDMAVFSFGNGKFPSMGGGGLLVINQPAYAQRVATLLNNLKTLGLAHELLFIGKRLANALVHSRTGERLLYRLISDRITVHKNERVSAVPARDHRPYRIIGAALNRQFAQFDALARRQRMNARYLINRHRHAYKLLGDSFSVVLLTDRRNELYGFLRQRGIGAGKHFQHALIWAVQFGYRPGDCPAFERLVGQVLTLPCHYGLTNTDLRIIDRFLDDFKKRIILHHEEGIGRH